MHLPFPFHNRARHPHVSPDTTVQMGRHHVLLVGPATLVPLLPLLHQRCRAMVIVTDPREGASGSDGLLVLTTEEYALLQPMARQGGTPLQPDESAAAVWGENVTRTSTSIRPISPSARA